MALITFSNSNFSGLQGISTNGGLGQGTVGQIPTALAGYNSYAVDPSGLNAGTALTTPLFGIKADGSSQQIAELERFGTNRLTLGDRTIVTGGDIIDNRTAFALQTTGNQSLVFSNEPLTAGQTLNFTATRNDYVAPICFTTGTLIRTARGEVAVEDLIVGDLAVTASGTLRPITWIGNRALDAKGEALPHNEQPIRIRAGAFGPGLPARDLRLSHGHPVLVGADANGEGGVLVPVMCLINGTSVLREPATQVTYWHIELDAHDILLAEGLAAESYYDMGSRVWFAGEDGMLTDPDFVPAGEHGRCRPVAVDGTLVDGERKRLDAVFAGSLDASSAWDAADSAEWLTA